MIAGHLLHSESPMTDPIQSNPIHRDVNIGLCLLPAAQPPLCLHTSTRQHGHQVSPQLHNSLYHELTATRYLILLSRQGKVVGLVMRMKTPEHELTCSTATGEMVYHALTERQGQDHQRRFAARAGT